MIRTRRWSAWVGVAAAVAGLSCGDGAAPPVAGMLTVRLTTPHAGSDGAVLFTVAGPAAITAASAPPGLRVFEDGFGQTSTSFAVTGDLPMGPILTIMVPDVRQAEQYVAVIQQVAAADYALRPLDGYALTIGP